MTSAQIASQQGARIGDVRGHMRPYVPVLADKNYFGRAFEASIAQRGIQLLRRARKSEPERAGGRFFKPLRQTVESIFDTSKATSTSNSTEATPTRRPRPGPTTPGGNDHSDLGTTTTPANP